MFEFAMFAYLHWTFTIVSSSLMKLFVLHGGTQTIKAVGLKLANNWRNGHCKALIFISDAKFQCVHCNFYMFERICDKKLKHVDDNTENLPENS